MLILRNMEECTFKLVKVSVICLLVRQVLLVITFGHYVAKNGYRM